MDHVHLEPVAERIFLVRGQVKPSFPPSHSVLIRDEETVLIDTGCGIDLLEQLRDEYGVDYIINSHTHPDHSSGNWVFDGRPIHVPAEGFETSGDREAMGERFAKTELSPVLQGHMERVWGFKPCRPTHSYNGQTKFSFGRTSFELVHTPGHSNDHYCFFDPVEGILLSFDYDLTCFPWYGHVESDLPLFVDSVNRLRALSPKVVVTAHRGVVREDVDAEFDAYLGILDERGQRILSLLDRGGTLDQLVDRAPIYGSFPYIEPVMRFWEGQMILEHLRSLEAAGLVRRQGDLYLRA
jgi:glyoxylase-like metal-dependent hydrolase (beta-lactamase superfamily II)